MARAKPYRRIEIDEVICAKYDRIIEENRYRGSFTSFLESILDLYADGLLKDVREKPMVTTTRVRIPEGVQKGEAHRKAV